MIKHKKTALPIEKQQEITKLVLEHIQKGTDIKDQLLKCIEKKKKKEKKNGENDILKSCVYIFIVVDNKPSELSDFGNVLLTSSKCKCNR
jgi:hypothetical protein